MVQRKARFREAVRQKLKEQSAELRKVKSRVILERLKRKPEFQKSRVIMSYVSLAEEVDTRPLLKEALQEGRAVTVPYLDKRLNSLMAVQIHDPKKNLVRGTYGILEPRPELTTPFDLNRLDVVLVPGIAFDYEGHRLGRGRGYYDRFLKTLPPHVKRYGLAFDIQMFDSIPVDDSDVSVDEVITNAD